MCTCPGTDEIKKQTKKPTDNTKYRKKAYHSNTADENNRHKNYKIRNKLLNK